MSGQSGQLTSFLAVDQLNEILAVIVVVIVVVVCIVVIAVGGVLIALKNVCKKKSKCQLRRHKSLPHLQLGLINSAAAEAGSLF